MPLDAVSIESGVDGSYVVRKPFRSVTPFRWMVRLANWSVRPESATCGQPIHFNLTAPGHKQIVTHLFRHGDQYLDADAVFAVKNH